MAHHIYEGANMHSFATLVTVVAVASIAASATPHAQAIDFHGLNAKQLDGLLTRLARDARATAVWTRKHTNPPPGDDDVDPDDREERVGRHTPDYQDEVGAIWRFGEDGLLICYGNICADLKVPGGSDGSPPLVGGSDESSPPGPMVIPPGIWREYARPYFALMAQAIAEVEAETLADGWAAEDAVRRAEWESWGYLPEEFNDCAYEAERQSRE